MSCETIPYFPENRQSLGICSGNGVCVNGTCRCNAGFTGRSDFLNTFDYDCQINEMVVKVLWGSVFAVSALIWLHSVPRVYQRLKMLRKERLKDVALQPVLLSIFVFNFMTIPCSGTFVLLKLNLPDERIGITLPATALFFVSNTGFYLSIFFFQNFLMQSLLRANKKLRGLSGISLAFNLYNLFVSCGCGAIPFVTLYYSDGLDLLARKVYLSYFGIYGISLFSYTFQSAYILYKVSKLLVVQDEVGAAAERVRRVRRALLTMQAQGVFHSIMLGSIYITFASFPFLWNRHDYFLPIVWLSGTIVWRYMAMSAIPQAHTAVHHEPEHEVAVTSTFHAKEDMTVGPTGDVTSYTHASAVTFKEEHVESLEFKRAISTFFEDEEGNDEGQV